MERLPRKYFPYLRWKGGSSENFVRKIISFQMQFALKLNFVIKKYVYR